MEKSIQHPLDFTGIHAVMIVAPSGGGKGTVIEKLLRDYSDKFFLSKSDTTKVDTGKGEFYEFISKKEFKARILRGHYIEFEEINGDFYGTPQVQFDTAQKEGRIVLLDIDVKGAARLKSILAASAIRYRFFFIDSGDFIESSKEVSVYEKRIRERGRGESEEKIRKRIDRIPGELSDGRFEADVIVQNVGEKQDLLNYFNGCRF
jgi:guanylate kinase